MKNVSLKVIAAEVNVSIATVSLVLNGKNINGRVSEEVSRKIIEKAKELNYTPNSLAKSLKVGKSKTIGLIIADISNEFFGSIALHLQKYAEKKGYTVIIGNTNENLDKLNEMIALFKSKQVDGFIISPTEKSKSSIKSILKQNIPLVLIDRSYPDINASSVIINNREISYKSTLQLIKQGCKNIAFVTYKLDHYHLDERKEGFITAVKENGLYNNNTIQYVKYSDVDRDIGRVVNKLLKLSPKIDGIFFSTNSLTIRGIKSLLKNKIDLEKEVQIICFDESVAYYFLPHSVPFIMQPIEEIAKQSIDILLDQINEKDNQVKKTVLNAKLSFI